RVGGSGAVYSFEPNPLSFYILSLNIKLNRLENVKAHQVALSRHEGCAFMSYSEMPIFFSTYSDGKQKVKVRTSTLDAFISNADVDKVDVIKIDAEGFELDILLGGHLTLERGAASRLIIEAHRIIYGKRVYEVKQLVALLSEHGYLIDLIDDVDAYTSIIYARHHR
ncbi:MAG: FkbM family methyltransferase, partial [Candidatus Nezhaarchaeota archaeon]|nr:FkbM family methyltransferase [Candidatus Nezhaarchaeota archaeon]